MQYKQGDKVIVISKSEGRAAELSGSFLQAQKLGYAFIDSGREWDTQCYIIGGDFYAEKDLLPYIISNRAAIHYLKK